MAFQRSTLEQLRRARERGQAPDGFVVIGESAARDWCDRNRFFFVDARDLTEDTLPFAGLLVVVRSHRLHAGSTAIQAIALVAAGVTDFDMRRGVSTFVTLGKAA